MKIPSHLLLVSLVAVVAGLGLISYLNRPVAKLPLYEITKKNLTHADSLPQPEKKKVLADYVASNSSSPDITIQDTVSAARMKLAYIEASEKDMGEAREIFLEAESEHKGSDAQDPSFGEITDQARYQAINCLMAEGKEDQARNEYVDFLKTRPLSPLVYGIHKRLIKMVPEGKSRDEYDQLLQIAVDKQQIHAKREMALCGPRCIQEFFKLKNIAIPELDALERECGTTDDGTTMTGIQKAFVSRGFVTEGMLVSNNDFRRQQTPFIWLDQAHYLLVKQIKPGSALVYDPFIKNDREISIPAASDKAFSATILTIQPKKTGANK